MTLGAASKHEAGPAGPDNAVSSGEGARIIDLATRNALITERPRPRDERFGMFAGLAVVALLVAITIWTIWASREKPGRPAAARAGQEVGWPGKLPLPGLPDVHELSVEIPKPTEQAPASSMPAPDLAPVLANPTVMPEVSDAPLAEPIAKPSAGPTVVFESGPGDSPVGFAFGPGEGSDFGGSVKSERTSPPRSGGGKTVPSGSNVDRSRTLGRGTLIPAILETAIDSNVPGGVRAVVSTDVLSSDGKRSLVPRSSRLIGQYKTRRSGGQNSAYVVWTQIVRPDGVRLDIPSSVAGASERQFFERFSLAKLVSVIAGQSGSDLRARQGEPLRIMAARDIDLAAGR